MVGYIEVRAMLADKEELEKMSADEIASYCGPEKARAPESLDGVV